MSGSRAKYLRRVALRKGISYKLVKKAWKVFKST